MELRSFLLPFFVACAGRAKGTQGRPQHNRHLVKATSQANQIAAPPGAAQATKLRRRPRPPGGGRERKKDPNGRGGEEEATKETRKGQKDKLHKCVKIPRCDTNEGGEGSAIEASSLASAPPRERRWFVLKIQGGDTNVGLGEKGGIY